MFCYDAAIIGAGPSGLICARNAARRGLSVAIIDSHKQPGAKIAIAGGGRGNFTNRTLTEGHYLTDSPAIVRSILHSFPCEKVLELLRELHLPFEERDFGQIFGLRPASFMADRLAIQCDDAHVDFYLGCTASGFTLPSQGAAFGRAQASTFSFRAGQEKITARKLVFASGSPACPAIGSNDALARLAASWGHKVEPFRPVLVPLVMPPKWPLSGLEGISLNVRAGLRQKGTELWPDPEGIRPMLFTHRGASGPAMLTLSCWWHPGDEIIIDFLPELPILELLDARENGRLIVRSVLSRVLPLRLADILCPEDLSRRKCAEIGKKDRMRLAEAVHRFSCIPDGTEGMKKAEAAAGGILLSSLSRSLESRMIPGLYFCGEILNATGLLGGYNIHWALASGTLVAKALAEGKESACSCRNKL
ncbi:MAG: aminoacetone oxidase family FAD-binding enzyme [Mailhella sp.]